MSPLRPSVGGERSLGTPRLLLAISIRPPSLGQPIVEVTAMQVPGIARSRTAIRLDADLGNHLEDSTVATAKWDRIPECKRLARLDVAEATG